MRLDEYSVTVRKNFWPFGRKIQGVVADDLMPNGGRSLLLFDGRKMEFPPGYLYCFSAERQRAFERVAEHQNMTQNKF